MLCSDRAVQPVQALDINAPGGRETDTDLHGVAVARGVYRRSMRNSHSDVTGRDSRQAATRLGARR
ncbi:MAG TPA: hypothetical protein VLB12_08255, partial [Gemmatimonadales bacterium]|nr:hypothetical protein [Gemmatimonadales bacterium]